MISKKEYVVNWINSNHKFVTYYDDGYEQLHQSQSFGFTEFSNDIDKINCELTCDLFYTNENGSITNIPRKMRPKFCGRELIIYNEDGTIKFDEWVYIDTNKHNHNIYDINGYELTFGG